MPMPHSVYDYTVVRLVPRVERGEYINVGVILFCRPRRFLDAQIGLNAPRLHALWPNIAPADVEPHLALIPLICAGGSAAGPIGELSQSERFHWLAAPRSTMIQPAPVRSGHCVDPATTLAHLFAQMVLV